MALHNTLRSAMKQLSLGELVTRQQYVDTNGDSLGVEDLALIWALGVEEGITSVDKLIEEFGLTDNKNLAIVTKATMDDLRQDFEEIQKSDPEMYMDFDEYWEGFPTRIQLPDGKWLVWGE